MQVIPHQWKSGQGWSSLPTSGTPSAQFVLYFASRSLLEESSSSPIGELRKAYPGAVLAGCSTAGEIAGTRVNDDTISAVAVHFDSSRVRGVITPITSAEESEVAAARLAKELLAPDLRHVLVLSDGLHVNGSALAAGFRAVLPPVVQATGGLAGDGAAFRKTIVGLDEDVGPDRLVAIGFYGPKLQACWGSAGGWTAFGPRRLITRAKGNVLYELDGQPALGLYKRYLGQRAADLPASGLLYPLELLPELESTGGLVRTILAVDEKEQSLTFAGDIPEGSYTRLMKAGLDGLVDGASSAAGQATGTRPPGSALAVLVSCVGRKLVMGQRVEEEVEAVQSRLGSTAVCTGFYSYGELCPSEYVPSCELHNQTMTLTVLSEEN